MPALVAAGAALLVAALGGAATDTGPWYQALCKPPWQPPDWLFPTVWTAIFALAALAGARAWLGTPDPIGRERLIAAWVLNASLNVLWSVLFFTLKRPDWALVEVVPLWLSVLLLLVVSGRRDRAAGWLLLPYLVWVGFAGVLNWSVVGLNGPFSGS
jgi:tryptophan-rich sensory protein